MLCGDPGRLRQILLNLVGNAVKFTESGDVSVRISLREKTSSNALLHFSVRDTGIGIPADKIGLLFGKFTQLDSSITRQFGGTGLGLAISRQLVELMGGKICVESTDGSGSEFTFDLDLKLPNGNELSVGQGSGAEDSGIGQGEAPKCFAGRDLLILLVEDHPINQKLFIAILKNLGLKSDLAVNGAEAIKRLASARYDLVFMDVQMPVMDGIEATGRIRSGQTANTGSTVPIIAMTADAMDGGQEKMYRGRHERLHQQTDRSGRGQGKTYPMASR